MMPRKAWSYTLIIIFLIEIGSYTFLANALGKYLAPIVMLLTSLMSIYIGAKLLIAPAMPVDVRPEKKPVFLKFLFISVGFVILVCLVWLWLRRYYNQYPLDPSYSDIIPVIKRFNQRFIQGQDVYQQFSEFGYSAFPTYLPMMWLPFIVADWLSLDYRTWAYLIFSAVLLISTFLIRCIHDRLVFPLVLPFASSIVFLWHQPSALGWTVETMVAGFYVLLAVGIYLQKPLLIGIALILCLLSRFSILLWLPTLFLLMYFYGNKKQTVLSALIVMAGVVIIFVIPFLVNHPDFPAQFLSQYSNAALGEWNGQSWQKDGELPFQLSQHFGFAIYFYKWGAGDLLQRLRLLQSFHLIVSIAVPILMILWYVLQKKRRLPLKWYLLFSLKIYLVIFFLFIQVPYAYLFLTPLVISVFTYALLFDKVAAFRTQKDYTVPLRPVHQ